MADMIQEADEPWADFLEIYLSERETDPSDIPDLDIPDLPTQKYLQISAAALLVLGKMYVFGSIYLFD